MEEQPKVDTATDVDAELAELNTQQPELVANAAAQVEATTPAPVESQQETATIQVRREQMANEARAAIEALPDDVLLNDHNLLESAQANSKLKKPNPMLDSLTSNMAAEAQRRNLQTVSQAQVEATAVNNAMPAPEAPAKKGFFSFLRRG